MDTSASGGAYLTNDSNTEESKEIETVFIKQEHYYEEENNDFTNEGVDVKANIDLSCYTNLEISTTDLVTVNRKGSLLKTVKKERDYTENLLNPVTDSENTCTKDELNKDVFGNREVYICDDKSDNVFNKADNVDTLSSNNIHKYQCKICFKTFQQKNTWKIHIMTHSDKTHKCPLCNKSFSLSSYLRSHYRLMHNTVKNQRCTKCDKCFTKPSVLKKHMLVHSDTNEHKCTLCDKSFVQPRSLTRHLLTHDSEISDIRPYQCEVCRKKFKEACTLKTHMLIHSTEKAHKCTQCFKYFDLASSLKKHIWLIHRNKKSYKCTLCNKFFSQETALNLHMLMHSDTKAHKCTQCEKTFTQAIVLKRHLLLHGPMSEHKCTLCSKRFKQAAYLKKHLWNVHSKTMNDIKTVDN